jgi:hypothetical protein
MNTQDHKQLVALYNHTAKSGATVRQWPDTIRVRLYCANVEKSSIGAFKRDGDYFTLLSLVAEQPGQHGKGGPAAKLYNDVPAELLLWGKASCPYCGGATSKMIDLCGSPFHCECGKLRCLSGVYRRQGALYFRCTCGASGPMEAIPDLKVSLEPVARPRAAGLKPYRAAGSGMRASSTPALPAAYDPIALPAPGRRGQS